MRFEIPSDSPANNLALSPTDTKVAFVATTMERNGVTSARSIPWKRMWYRRATAPAILLVADSVTSDFSQRGS